MKLKRDKRIKKPNKKPVVTAVFAIVMAILFSSIYLKTPGTYKVVIGGSESYPFSIGRMTYDMYDNAMQLFTVQRCGVEVPGWHGVCHADDATVDGVQIDASGGWHDAGDYNNKQWSLAEFRYLRWGTDAGLKQEIFGDLEKLIGAGVLKGPFL